MLLRHQGTDAAGAGPARGTGGFTLIELVVVVAILCVLGALLTPAAEKARATAQERTCASNLRAWGVAFLLYAGDHQGYLPHTDGRERNATPGVSDPAHPEHEQGYMDVLPPYLGERPWRDYPDGGKPTGGIWQCPRAHALPDSAYSYSPSRQGYFSYAMNSYLEHDFYFGLPANAELQPSFLALSKCVTPAQTILMFEQTLNPSQGSGQKGSLRTAGLFAAEDARALAERHSHTRGGLGSNVLYLDGHVGWRNDLWDPNLKNPRIPARGDPTWCPYAY